jgi:hypothetical protein
VTPEELEEAAAAMGYGAGVPPAAALLGGCLQAWNMLGKPLFHGGIRQPADACFPALASPETVWRPHAASCAALMLVYCLYCPAVKYADLKSHRTTNYKFSYDDMLSQQVGRLHGHAATLAAVATNVACGDLRRRRSKDGVVLDS